MTMAPLVAVMSDAGHARPAPGAAGRVVAEIDD